ncbi:Arm DNA-binding domain-containing protein [Hydrotalea sp.]|uniref:Arm DNA-binding domain-containing protein n=1 Tax=Hydrotalea sp. TaxID=2881279 RepID=UPI0025837AF3|nr:Arm DNA-binding domain-containing protein [Hydrotalea sp.]
MGRITIDGTPKSFSTKLDINPNNWDLKHGRVWGKSAYALSINLKLDNIKLSFLGVGVMDDAILSI